MLLSHYTDGETEALEVRSFVQSYLGRTHAPWSNSCFPRPNHSTYSCSEAQLGSAGSTAVLSESKGLRSADLEQSHQRNSPEAHCLAYYTDRFFPCEIKTPSPGPGSQEDPRSTSRITQSFMLPGPSRNWNAREA